MKLTLPFLYCSSRTILEKYLKNAVNLANENKATDKKSIARQAQTHFHLAHYADALFRSYEERLTSNEWQAALRLRKHKVVYTFNVSFKFKMPICMGLVTGQKC